MRNNKKASPFGRGGNACIDGEGKPVVKESRYSDEQKPLAEGEHRCALCSRAAALPSQALTRQDRVAAPSIRYASLASCWPLPQQLLPFSAAGARVAFAAFSSTPWRGLEKVERCPSLASLHLPLAAVGSATVVAIAPKGRAIGISDSFLPDAESLL